MIITTQLNVGDKIKSLLKNNPQIQENKRILNALYYIHKSNPNTTYWHINNYPHTNISGNKEISLSISLMEYDKSTNFNFHIGIINLYPLSHYEKNQNPN